MLKPKITAVLTLCLVLTLTLNAYAFNEPTDIRGHWAQKQIVDWIDKGLTKGYTDGTFKPDQGITRAEFAALVNRAFKFNDQVTINFQDVSSTDWFYNEIARAKAAGYLSGYEDGTIKPNSIITRQEVASILARILKLENADTQVLSAFKDAADIPAWSKQTISAVVVNGYLRGYPDQTFQPLRSITRAEAIATLDRAIGQSPIKTNTNNSITYSKAGTYGPNSGKETITGNVLIDTKGVTLQNTIILGDLVLSEEIGDGDVKLKNVEVKGNTLIKGGGQHSVILEDCVLPSITVSKEGVRVVASGNTSVRVVRLESGASLVEVTTTGPGFQQVTVSQVVSQDSTVNLEGNFTTVEVAASEVNVQVTNGTVENLNISNTATHAVVNLDEDTVVNTLNLDAQATVTGDGIARNRTVSNQAGTIDSTVRTGNTTGGGGGSSSTVAVTGITLNSSSQTLEIGQATTLQANVDPPNATNKAVTWISDNPQVAKVDTHGKVTGIAKGTATITATSQSDTTKKATCQVTVLGNINVTPLSNLVIRSGATTSIDITADPLDVTLIATSDDEDVATTTVEANTVKVTGGNSPGTTTITLTLSKAGYKSETVSFAVEFPIYNVSQEKYYNKIQAALDAASANDEITVKAGEYKENLTINTAGVKLIGPNPSWVEVMPDDHDISNYAVIYGKLLINGNDSLVSGLAIGYTYPTDPKLGYNDNSYVVEIANGVTGVTISNNIIGKILPEYPTTDRNWGSRLGQAGIMASGNNGIVTITGNLVSRGPIAIKKLAEQVTINHNAVQDTWHEGIWIVEAQDIVMKDNNIEDYNLSDERVVKAVKIVRANGSINGLTDESKFETQLLSDNPLLVSQEAHNVNLEWIAYVDDDADESWYDNLDENDLKHHVKSIQEAVNVVPKGGIVCVAPGVYAEDSSIILDKPITLRGPQAGVSIDQENPAERSGGEAIIDAKESFVGLLVDPHAGDICVDGFTVINGIAGIVGGERLLRLAEDTPRLMMVKRGSVTIQYTRLFNNLCAAVSYGLPNIHVTNNTLGSSVDYEGPSTPNVALFSASKSAQSSIPTIASQVQNDVSNYVEQIETYYQANKDKPQAKTLTAEGEASLLAARNPLDDLLKSIRVGTLLINTDKYQFTNNDMFSMTAGIIPVKLEFEPAIRELSVVEDVYSQITDNYIHGNRFAIGLILGGAQDTLINHNKITSNMLGMINIVGNMENDIDATENWWGATDEVNIAPTILDASAIIETILDLLDEEDELAVKIGRIKYFPWSLNENFTATANGNMDILVVNSEWKGLDFGHQVIGYNNSDYYYGRNAFGTVEAAQAIKEKLNLGDTTEIVELKDGEWKTVTAEQKEGILMLQLQQEDTIENADSIESNLPADSTTDPEDELTPPDNNDSENVNPEGILNEAESEQEEPTENTDNMESDATDNLTMDSESDVNVATPEEQIQ